ncbi:MAG: hypothetical protein GY757_03445 [bacterium]|nr:hypothetical protein [bacterium]
MKDLCQQIKHTFPDYLTGDLESNSCDQLQSHISQCTACHKELEELTLTWSHLGILPEEEPGENLRKNFYTMLDSYQEGQSKSREFSFAFSLKNLFEKFFPRNPGFQAALVVFLLVGGFVGGYFFSAPRSTEYNREISRLQAREQQMRHNFTLALLEQSSPSRRLKGLHLSATVNTPKPELLTALLRILNNDPNVNVRLSAIEALYIFADTPTVKKGISDALSNQTAPLVQVALIDLLVEIRQKHAADSLKKLVNQKKLNPSVKKHAQSHLDTLI